MRHHLVNRIVLALAAVWTVAVALFAWGASRPAAPSSGAPAEPAAGSQPERPDAAALFARHCASCHELEELREARAGSPDRAAAALELNAFLADHFSPSPQASAALAEHVLGDA